jgi:hypothetical protein
VTDDERRGFQRLVLTRPLDGWFGDWPVTLTDVSATGAQIESADDIPVDARALLRFFWRGEEIELTAETVRAHGGQCGLRFVEPNERLNQLIAASATEVLRAQQANADGARDENRVGDETLTAASSRVPRTATFLTWTLNDGAWRQRSSLLAEQPPDGFTVSAREEPEQIEMLRRTYESGDTEARRLTRLLAELSVAGSR